jgi:citrate/tricarballylate utilization protein
MPLVQADSSKSHVRWAPKRDAMARQAAEHDDLTQHGAHVMTVCNACRYCEQYCPVFPAMEEMRTFGKADLALLANLCHNCGECLYACQYAPPHEFGINVPNTLARIRLQVYQDYAWPRALGVAFTRHNLLTAIALAATFSAIFAVAAQNLSPTNSGDFYAVVPHSVMVTLFGVVFLFSIAAMTVGLLRFLSHTRGLTRGQTPVQGSAQGSAQGMAQGTAQGMAQGTAQGMAQGSAQGSVLIRDILTLRHLHASGADCVTAEEHRTPWRRWLHHCTFYGFLLCFASTTVAAIYDNVFGWRAPYDYTSLPVTLGTIGGAGLLIGSLGLWGLRRRRDRALIDETQDGLDESFLALLFLSTLTGLALLVLRREPMMPWLLIVHLGTVLALFVTLPYSKFVHGLYRAAALWVAR